jgi:hypothetical protein
MKRRPVLGVLPESLPVPLSFADRYQLRELFRPFENFSRARILQFAFAPVPLEDADREKAVCPGGKDVHGPVA